MQIRNPEARLKALVIAGLAVAVAFAAAAQTAPVRLRGKIKSIAGDALVVQPRDGAPVVVKLAATWAVIVMKPVDVGAIAPGSFIGTTTMERPDGTGRSLEVHVFPPGMKPGQGHYPWDLKPHSMMTNGDVGKVVATPKGRMVEVSYPGGMHQILVPPNVPVVAFTPGERAMLKPGVRVFIIPAKTADGTLSADRVVIGVNGAAPPM